MRTVKLITVIQSHLSDAILEMSIGSPESAKDRILFVKRLTFFNEDLNELVSDDYLNDQWQEMYKNRH